MRRIATMLMIIGAAAVSVTTASASPVGTAWTKAKPAASPNPRDCASMAYDAATKQVVLFSGTPGPGAPCDTAGDYLTDTWIWDGHTWSEVGRVNGPPARVLAAMAYDAATSQVVLFGGSSNAGTYLNDTWTWNGRKWAEQFPVTSPSARFGASLAYDPATSQLILFGGYDGSEELADTWTWNGHSWTEMRPSDSPSGRGIAALAYDPATSQMLLFGGSTPLPVSDTWTWNGHNWIEVHPATIPPAVAAASMAYEPAVSGLVLFGGQQDSVATEVLSQTWRWNGSNWVVAHPAKSPPARSYATFAFDAATSESVLFGGYSASGTHLGDTWTLP